MVGAVINGLFLDFVLLKGKKTLKINDTIVGATQ